MLAKAKFSKLSKYKTYLKDIVIDFVAHMRVWRYKHLSNLMTVIISYPQEKKQDAASG